MRKIWLTIIALILSICFAIAFVGCNTPSDPNGGNSNGQQTEQTGDDNQTESGGNEDGATNGNGINPPGKPTKEDSFNAN